jgi:aquaporin Z
VLHPSRPSLLARLGAEALGTFALVLIALGLALYAQLTGATSGLGTAMAVAFVLTAAALALGHVSGGHFNPAVTFGAVVAGRAPVGDLVPYWLAQIVGGALAAAALFVTIPEALPGLLQADGRRGMFSTTANGYGEHSPLNTLAQGQVTFALLPALLIELVATALLVAVVLGATSRRVSRTVAPLAMGLAYGALVLLTAPITNAGLNPARSTAAALFSEGWAFGQLWVFWVAPLLGAAIAGLAHRAFAVDAGSENLLEKDDLLVEEDSLLDDGVDEVSVSPRI